MKPNKPKNFFWKKQINALKKASVCVCISHKRVSTRCVFFSILFWCFRTKIFLFRFVDRLIVKNLIQWKKCERKQRNCAVGPNLFHGDNEHKAETGRYAKKTPLALKWNTFCRLRPIQSDSKVTKLASSSWGRFLMIMLDFIYLFVYPFLFSRLSRNSAFFANQITQEIMITMFHGMTIQRMPFVCFCKTYYAFVNPFVRHASVKCSIACKNSEHYSPFRVNLKRYKHIQYIWSNIWLNKTTKHVNSKRFRWIFVNERNI